ncbi:MAG: ATP synthase F1 subunit gamma [Methylocystaceae bacterium]
MAKGVREFKRRIRSVNNMKQITKAMKMVAAAKLRRAQDRAETSRPYTDKLADILARVAGMSGQTDNPYLNKHKYIKKVVYVVVTSDRGLCGAYNTNIIKTASNAINGENREVESGVVAVGRKARDFFRKRGYKVEGEFVNIPDNVSYAQAKEMANYVMKMYEEEAADEVYLVYAKFINALRQEPKIEKVLPIEPPDENKTVAKQMAEYIPTYLYEPAEKVLLDLLIPRYVESLVYHAVLESKASEQGARMTAMSNATENASELVSNMELEMNKARQSAITTELLEIVAGSEALKKGGK